MSIDAAMRLGNALNQAREQISFRCLAKVAAFVLKKTQRSVHLRVLHMYSVLILCRVLSLICPFIGV